MTDPLFQVHRLNEEGLKKAAEIAVVFDTCLNSIVSMCPPGRELAIVKNNLEQACFFAKKAMANDPNNQAVQ